MKNKKNEKPITLSDLGKFAEGVLLPAVEEIVDKRISSLENRISSLEDRIIGLENRMNGLKEEMTEVREYISKMKNDILNGQDALVKLIEDKRENRAMDTSICCWFEENFENYGEGIRIVEGKVGILAGA